MTLEELLEYTGAEYLDDRTALVAGDADELWSDSVLVRYFNEAEKILCRRAWVLIDIGHKDAGIIVLEQNRTLYPIHKSVLRVYKATPEDEEVPLARTTDETLDWYRPADTDYFDISAAATAAPGRPKAIATDAGTRQLRVYPPPSLTEEGLRLMLKVARLPVCPLSLDNTAASPEVDEQWHMSLAKYAAGRCLTHPTVDSDNKVDGRRLLAEFAEEVKEARQERLRAEMAPIRFVHASTTALL